MTAPGMAACVEVVGRKKAPMVNGFLDISAQTLALNERRKDPEQSVPNTLSNITDRFKYTLHLKKAYELKDQPLVVSMLAVVPLENGERTSCLPACLFSYKTRLPALTSLLAIPLPHPCSHRCARGHQRCTAAVCGRAQIHGVHQGPAGRVSRAQH